MKRSILSSAMFVLMIGAQAQARPSTTSMPCGASQRLVLSNGAVVLGTGGYTYDRFVRDGSFCAIGEYAQQAVVQSLDTPHCFVGYRCKQGRRDFWDD